jgi:hypothetical protein
LKNRGNNGPKFQRSEQADSLAGAVRNRISWINSDEIFVSPARAKAVVSRIFQAKQ